MHNIDKLKEIILKIPYVKKVCFIEQREFIAFGKIEIFFEGLEKPLDFEFEIFPQYPLKSYDSETINFINKDLLKYNHVMENGSICIHTTHNTDIEQKLLIDFASLKIWIEKYYINKNNDKNYEHIIVSESLINDTYHSYLFTDINHEFNKGDSGKVNITFLNSGIYKEKNNVNYLVQSFDISDNKPILCSWNKTYANYPPTNIGFYIYVETVPVKYNRFIFKNWKEFNNILPRNFLETLSQFEKNNIKKQKGKLFPLFIGYKTIEKETHWEVAMLEIGNFPITENHEENNGLYLPVKKLIDKEINWMITRNSSYKYFFGRGALCEKITNSKILIIGVGAIGSMLAKTLVKGGCKFIDIVDHDVKEPENVCRSEYLFNNGITDKVQELHRILTANSPFVEVNIDEKCYFESFIKSFYNNESKYKENITFALNEFDIIFDCTTDNDLMYVLNTLELDCDLINMSITNHAKDLVCAFHPNIYHFVNTLFNSILLNDLSDLYNPTGCWNPTFKASYNDINLLVQMAIKQINHFFDNDKSKNNFIVKTDIDKNFNIKLVQY